MNLGATNLLPEKLFDKHTAYTYQECLQRGAGSESRGHQQPLQGSGGQGTTRAQASESTIRRATALSWEKEKNKLSQILHIAGDSSAFLRYNLHRPHFRS